MLDLLNKLLDFLTGSKGRRGFLSAILFLAFFPICLWLYESYTKSFQLQRLSKEAETLTVASKICETVPISKEEQQMISTQRAQIIQELSLLRAKATFMSDIRIPLLFQNFIMGIVFWIAAAIASAKGEKDPSKKASGAFGLLFLGIFISIGAAFLPRFWIFVGHMFVYPIALMIGFLLLIVLIALPFIASAKKKTEQGAAANP